MFGEGPENTIVVASLCNGPGNYAFNGITKGEKRGIVIGCSTDKEGNPAYSRFLITVIVHELLHHYTNPCLAQYIQLPQVQHHKLFLAPLLSF